MIVAVADLVVVKREWDLPTGVRRASRTTRWTLHRSTCRFAINATGALPAPSVAYPNTVSCRFCCPLGEPPFKHNRKKMEPLPPYAKPRGHLNSYERRADGTIVATCCACKVVGVGISTTQAKRASWRAHRAADAKYLRLLATLGRKLPSSGAS